MAGKVYMVMALIMMGFVLQACNGMNVDPTEDSRFFCFRVCSIRCGKQNKPCYQECLPKCGLPRRLAKPTSPSSPSSTV
ncbi:BnaC02g48420D [Brassica napus]|uniref:BnaC02g48420D protein n=1 Tax=Brassica napus TaxID=3708 RepID=A0A078JJ26_BRANA|nr:BnaC02g48420D [Brassica napus]